MNFIHNTIDMRKVGEKTPIIKHIPTEWDDSDIEEYEYKNKHKTKISFIMKFFLFSFGVFLLAIAFATYTFFTNKNIFSDKNIDFIIKAPALVSGGEEINIPITIGNKNNIPLISSYVILSYKNNQDNNYIDDKKIIFGDIHSNSSLNQNATITLFGNEGDKNIFSAKLYYSLPESKAVYTKDLEPFNISIKSSPISLTVNSLNEMLVNTFYDFDIIVKNNIDKDIENLLISLRPTNNFIFGSSTLKLYNKNPSWLIKNISKNSQTRISFTGKFIGNINNVENLTFYAGTIKNEETKVNNFDNYNMSIENIYGSIQKSILLTGQFIDINISDDSTSGRNYIGVGENIGLTFNYKNNLNYPIDNVVITAKLFGDMIDKDEIIVENGFFDKDTNTIIWNSNTFSNLSQIQAKGEGSFKLRIKVSKNYIPNNSIKLELSVIGERNAEESVSNTQGVSIIRSWNVVE